MILVLTYHKVERGPEADSDFYTIQAEQLESQLKLLAQSGLHALAPEELLEANAGCKPAYLLSFDDGTRDHCEVVQPLLERYGCRGLFFVPTAKLNGSGYLDREMARQLHKAGHALGCHSHEHRRMDRLGEEDIRVQFEVSQRILGELTGSRPVFFAPVGGYMNRRVRELALESGIRVIRTMRWGYNLKPDSSALECIPVNRYVTDEGFRRMMVPHSQPLTYAAKEITKKLIPMRAYDPLRALFCGKLGRK